MEALSHYFTSFNPYVYHIGNEILIFLMLIEEGKHLKKLLTMVKKATV